MVVGIDNFIERFKDYTDCYTIIGGAACDILMTEADIDFRATKDIDMIVIMEARYKELTKVLWDYILEGGYRFGWKNSDEVHFYRFTEPKPGYPSMIELFSKEPDYINDVPTGIVPLHIDDETSSLSAILLVDIKEDTYVYCSTLIANWIDLICHNFPFAFFSQLFFIQPAVRFLFRKIFAKDIASRNS